MDVVDPISVANNLRQALAMLLIAQPKASGIIEVEGATHSGSIKIDKGDLVGVSMDHPEDNWDGQDMLTALLELENARCGFLEILTDNTSFAPMHKLHVPLLTVIGNKKVVSQPKPKPDADLALWFGEDQLFDQLFDQGLGVASERDTIRVFNTDRSYELDLLQALAEPEAAGVDPIIDELSSSAGVELIISETGSAADADPVLSEASSSANAERLISEEISSDTIEPVDKKHAGDLINAAPDAIEVSADLKDPGSIDDIGVRNDIAFAPVDPEQLQEFLSKDPKLSGKVDLKELEDIAERFAAEAESDPFSSEPEPDYESLRRNNLEASSVQPEPGTSTPGALDESELAALKALSTSAVHKAAQAAAEKGEEPKEAENADVLSMKARLALRRANENNLSRFGKTIGVSLALVLAIGVFVLPNMFLRNQRAETTAIQLANNPPLQSSENQAKSASSSSATRQTHQNSSQPAANQNSQSDSTSSSSSGSAAGNQYYAGNPNPTGSPNSVGRIRYLPGSEKYQQQKAERKHTLNNALNALEAAIRAAENQGVDAGRYRWMLSKIKADPDSEDNADEIALRVQVLSEELAKRVASKKFEMQQASSVSQTGLQTSDSPMLEKGPSYSAQRAALQALIRDAQKQGLDTGKYSDAMRTIKQDIHYRDRHKELAGKMQSLNNELVEKMNNREKDFEKEQKIKEAQKRMGKMALPATSPAGANPAVQPAGTSAPAPNTAPPSSIAPPTTADPTTPSAR